MTPCSSDLLDECRIAFCEARIAVRESRDDLALHIATNRRDLLLPNGDPPRNEQDRTDALLMFRMQDATCQQLQRAIDDADYRVRATWDLYQIARASSLIAPSMDQEEMVHFG